MKLQFLLAGIAAIGLFVSAPDAVAHGDFGGGSGGGHGGGRFGAFTAGVSGSFTAIAVFSTMIVLQKLLSGDAGIANTGQGQALGVQ